MKKAITEKAYKLGMHVSQNPIYETNKNMGWPYYLKYLNTWKIAGQFETEAEVEEYLDDRIEQNENMDKFYDEHQYLV